MNEHEHATRRAVMAIVVFTIIAIASQYVRGESWQDRIADPWLSAGQCCPPDGPCVAPQPQYPAQDQLYWRPRPPQQQQPTQPLMPVQPVPQQPAPEQLPPERPAPEPESEQQAAIDWNAWWDEYDKRQNERDKKQSDSFAALTLEMRSLIVAIKNDSKNDCKCQPVDLTQVNNRLTTIEQSITQIANNTDQPIHQPPAEPAEPASGVKYFDIVPRGKKPR